MVTKVKLADFVEDRRGSQHKMIRTTMLNAAYFNPEVRTSPRAIRGLAEAIRTDGQIYVDIQVLHKPDEGFHHVVIDGHRRVACALLLGVNYVPCRIHFTGDLEKLWVRLNKHSKNISQFEWLYAWYHTKKKIEDELPPETARNVALCVEMCGNRQAVKQMMLAQRIDPSVAFWSKRVWEELSKVDTLQKPQVLRWMISNRLTHSIRAIETGGAWTDDLRKYLYKLVTTDKDFSLTNWLSKVQEIRASN